MRNITEAALTGAALVFLACAPARSQVTLTTGSGWSVFEFAGVGSNFQDVNGNPLDYQFTITSNAGDTLLVTDGYNAGDQFDLCINAFCGLLTSTPVYDPNTYSPSYSIGNNWYDAYETPYSSAFSHISLLLGPGTYDVTGTEYAAGTGYEDYGGYGAGAISLVPEPSAWAMTLLGVTGVGFGLRRRRNSVGETAP